MIPGVKRVIAIASGKGGVGKSTVAANLALALAQQERAVGLLDADIYGPSQQLMMGTEEGPSGDSEGRIIPVTAPGGVKMMSFGFIVDPDQPVIWRGPMLQKALEQFFGDVLWGELDDLVVDLPPGTGDVALTLCQNVPLAGAVIVTTPQDVALIDARKGLNMFHKLSVNVLGIIENMSHFECPSCGHVEHVFGSGGGQRTAEALRVPFLGSVPLDPAIVAGGDSGRPVVLERPDSAAARAFTELAEQLLKLEEEPLTRKQVISDQLSVPPPARAQELWSHETVGLPHPPDARFRARALARLQTCRFPHPPGNSAGVGSWTDY